ncbi:hypothetical protein GQQ23_19445 [Pantoea agglomerans]|nr:hypothetical protein [Pantoea agglomerans]
MSHKSADSAHTGQSSSKRTHLRRGHIRRLKERLIWIRPSVINPDSIDGVITKDYRLIKK